MSYISEALEYLNILDENQSAKSAINSSMIIMLTHMLKCEYQPEYKNKSSWLASIWNSYKNIVSQFTAIGKGVMFKIFYMKTLDLDTLYKIAVKDASKETGKPLDIFPDKCPWTKLELVNLDFINNFIEKYDKSN